MEKIDCECLKKIIRFLKISMFSIFFLSIFDFSKMIFKKRQKSKIQKSDYFLKTQNQFSPWIINIFRSSQFCWRGMYLLFRFLAVMNTYKRILATGLVRFPPPANSRFFAKITNLGSLILIPGESACHGSIFLVLLRHPIGVSNACGNAGGRLAGRTWA